MYSPEKNEMTELALPEEKPTGVEIEIEVDATLGYASIQNSVPVVRALRLTNHGTESLEHLLELTHFRGRVLV